MRTYTLNATTTEQEQDIDRSMFLVITVSTAAVLVKWLKAPKVPQNEHDFIELPVGRYTLKSRKNAFQKIIYKTASGTATIKIQALNDELTTIPNNP